MKTRWKDFDIATLPTRLVHHFDLCNIWTVNSYLMCNFGCLYCSSNMQGDARPLVTNEEAIEVLRKELHDKPMSSWINFGTMTDPYPPLEEKLQLKLVLQMITKMLGRLDIRPL